MRTIKKVASHIFIDGFGGMTQGLFATLIIGTMIQQIGLLIGGSTGNVIYLLGKAAAALTSAGIGVGVAVKYGESPLVTVSAAVAAMAGGYAGKITGGQENICEGTTTIRDPRLWSAETPSLYTVQLELLDAAGNVLEATSQQYGFRKIEIRNNKVYINNALILFKGANRHDIHPQFGKAVPVESMIEDILLFKRFNLNTIRTLSLIHI